MSDDTNLLDDAPPTGANGQPLTPEAEAEARRERDDVKKWLGKIHRAREYDKDARRQYAKDRRYARGDSAFRVESNLIGTFIDILESFLYARDPDFDVRPGPAARPPSADAIRDAIEDEIRQSPEVTEAGIRAGQQAAAQAAYDGKPTDLSIQEGMAAGQMAADMLVEEKVRARTEEILGNFRRRQREIKSFAEGCEIIGTRMWTDASLKRRARPQVRSGLTIGVGWLKATWQERTAHSPATAQEINDLKQQIDRIEAIKRRAEEGGFFAKVGAGVRNVVFGDDSKLAELRRQEKALAQRTEMEFDRKFLADMVPGEDIQIAPGYTLANYLDSPWMAHRIFITDEEAETDYKLTKDEIAKCATYRARKPMMVQNDPEEVRFAHEQVDPAEADAMFVKDGAAGAETAPEGEDCQKWLCLWEIWVRGENSVLTAIEGLPRWAAPSWNPPATSRFYGFFLFATSEVDGQRHPQSLTSRSYSLVDEFNRRTSNEAEHIARSLPKTVFDAGLLAKGEAKKLARGGRQEMVGIKTTQPGANLANLIVPVNYAGVDPALYDTRGIMDKLERIWGIQEALSGGVDTPKTATEADIQQQGFQARTSGRRDVLETMLGELALYTVEIARKYVTPEMARAIAGPDVFWPEYEGPEDMLKLLTVDIRAGSSGKPNTAAERESMAALLPILQNGIIQIGQLRQASPAAIADSLEQVIRLVAERSGERIDIDQLIPQADTGMPAMMPGAVPPGGAPAPGGPGVPPGEAPIEDQAGGAPGADPLNPQP